MAIKGPTTIAEYIAAAPPKGQPHLSRLYEILKSVAPEAEETLKWNTPFFIEPRFVFAFSAHKTHASFAPYQASLKAFGEELENYQSTRNTLKLPYKEPLPEDLIRRIAEHSLRTVKEREDGSFW